MLFERIRSMGTKAKPHDGQSAFAVCRLLFPPSSAGRLLSFEMKFVFRIVDEHDLKRSRND